MNGSIPLPSLFGKYSLMVRIIDCGAVDKSSILFTYPRFCILMDRILDYESRDKGSNPFRNIFH